MFLKFLILLIGVQSVSACSVVHYESKKMPELLSLAEIVVFGKDIERYQVNDTSIGGFTERTDSKFEVYCVFKNPDSSKPIPPIITINTIDPRSTCSKTEYKQGEKIILGLKRLGDDFEWDEVNVWDNMAFPATEKNLDTTSNLCGLELLREPAVNQTEKCPARPTKECYDASSAPEMNYFKGMFFFVTIVVLFSTVQ